jgi:hypothetical protein
VFENMVPRRIFRLKRDDGVKRVEKSTYQGAL